MNNPIFQNPVGTIYKGTLQVKDFIVSINDLSVIQYTTIQNGKIDFFLIITSIVFTILSLVFKSLLILLIAFVIGLFSKFWIIEYHYLFFGIHKNQEIIVKEINKVNKKDIELFIKHFNIEKGIS
ncbi:hypothetical protein GCM10022389_29300 [Flavobacterium cheonanense]|jgi:hypothetical protein|uniref:Uncharacterized protein n=1 Tax=Flavobacterium cheonanense TaxID=706183 RepID=A0ABP7W5T2_9FLAO